MCLYCHRTKVFSTMQKELRKRGAVGSGQDFAALCRREAWHREREAKRAVDVDKKTAIMELVAEMRRWADEEDQEAIADQAPMPIIDRVGRER
jgi:NADH:ubiquinone oxidoreductase subunit E